MSALVLCCGNVSDTEALFSDVTTTDADVREMPARPGRSSVDPLIKDLDGRRLVVHGTDADLAAVVQRLMRTERLGEVPVGFVPADPRRSAIPSLWGIPAHPRQAAKVALGGEIDHVPLVRDDAGGVLVGLGVLRSVRGVAYCDDATALRGRANRIEVTPDPDGGAGLIVRVIRIGLLGKRIETTRGRAFQIGCLPVIPELNGVAHPRDVSRWTWYRHTEDLRVARGLI